MKYFSVILLEKNKTLAEVEELNYTDYCTAFYDEESGKVYFYDEIKNKIIGRQQVSGKVEADIVMRVWQDNAPQGIICELLSAE